MTTAPPTQTTSVSTETAQTSVTGQTNMDNVTERTDMTETTPTLETTSAEFGSSVTTETTSMFTVSSESRTDQQLFINMTTKSISELSTLTSEMTASVTPTSMTGKTVIHKVD